MQVSFIIPLFNCLPLTQAMLASLQATLPAALAYEIIFVDDGSTDSTRGWLARLQDQHVRVLLNERNFGYAISNNRGAAVARGEFLALLNNDLVLQAGWLEPMLAAHAALGSKAGVIGNVQLDATTGVVDHAGLVVNVTGKPVHARSRPHALSRALQPVRPVPAVTGACMIITRSLWQELGGFDEQYVNGGEDFDLCLRARELGRVNAVALRSIIRHHVSSSPGRKARDEQNSYRLALRWRNDLIALAEAGTREWCRDYLLQSLRVPESREYKLALAALAYVSRARRKPPTEAIAGVKDGLQREFERWEGMFPDGPRA